MNAESLLLTIEGSFGIGVAAGLIVGILLPRPKLGCVVLLAVPVAMIFFISWWQGEHPENLRSTSGLDFVFGPLWPSFGALGGYYAGMWLRRLSTGAANVRFPPIADAMRRRPMRLSAIVSTAIALCGCTPQATSNSMFVRPGEADGVSEQFLRDALSRLTPHEKKLYSSQVGGFLFRGQKRTCIVIVTFRGNVIIESPSPVFCYDQKTNQFVERL